MQRQLLPLFLLAVGAAVTEAVGDAAVVYLSTRQTLLRIVARAVEINKSPETASLHESEEKFSRMTLAFKTDQQTLNKRIELHLRSKELAACNIQKELEGLRAELQALGQLCNSPSSLETFGAMTRHVEVLEQAIAQMSSLAGVHGAIQQELRASEVVDALLNHAENLKTSYEKEHAELQDARKSLQDIKIPDELAEGNKSAKGTSSTTVDRKTHLFNNHKLPYLNSSIFNSSRINQFLVDRSTLGFQVDGSESGSIPNARSKIPLHRHLSCSVLEGRLSSDLSSCSSSIHTGSWSIASDSNPEAPHPVVPTGNVSSFEDGRMNDRGDQTVDHPPQTATRPE